MILKLDADQQRAVEHFEGPALVVAGPGSGKTTVIKERILNLIQKHGVDPEHILAIAFTNAAADEMNDRFKKETLLKQGEPKICTLHTFGKNLITNHHEHELLRLSKAPDIWDEKKVRQIIKHEKTLLDQETKIADVAIYKIEDTATGRCYIGQTTDPDRRKKEHFDHSSNRGLYEALQKGDEELFDFDVIERVEGSKAYPREKYWIDHYRNRSVFNLVHGIEQVASQSVNVHVTIYKIKSLTDVTAYIGYTTDPESICKIIESEGNKRFTFEVIRTEVPWTEAFTHIANEIKDHKNWAVFNREDPEKARYSNQLRIEVFCEYFNLPYEEVLAHPEKFENLMDRFDDLKEDIEKAKQQVNTGLFNPDKIADPVLRAFAKKYEKRKKEADAIDFLDMLIYPAYLLETDSDLHQYYRDKHRYVFIDEFQDISPLDFRLIDLFSENLFAVGDDDQAIYGFRGGDSEIMQKRFGNRKNVKIYKITRNYRSTSTIVRHAKTLIGHNPVRIPKNLHTNNFAQSQVEVLETAKGTVKAGLLRQLFNLLTTDFQKIGILARNWRGEINEIQEILKSSELDKQGFEIDWEELGDPGEDSDESDGKNRRKMFLRRDKIEIEVINIHTAKGREWDKVILLVNTMYDSLPDKRNDSPDERRLFYVAVTRAKQELIVLDGGNCQFIPEFQNIPLTKENLEETFREELAVHEPKLKMELEEDFKIALATRELRLKEKLEVALNAAHKQHEPDISRLERVAAEAKNAKQNVQRQIIEELPQQKKISKNVLLEELIPVLDTFESQLNSLRTTVESNEISDDFVEFTKSARLAQEQLLDSLKNHGLTPIGTSSGAIFNPVHHEELCPEIYSNGVPAGTIARQEQHGYLLHDQIVRKVRVVISKRKQRADALLCHDFAQPVRFVTYAGFRDLRNIETFKDGVKGHDSQGKVVQLQNPNVLFTFPKEDMKTLKSHIKTRRAIVDQNLHPIELISERFHTADDSLKPLLVKEDEVESGDQTPTVQFVTRSGHVLNGHLRDFDEDFLYMHISKKVVIVYRAGILKYKNLKWNEITMAYKNGTSINGHVTDQIKGGLRVKFKSLIGFLPASQVELKTVRNLNSYVGKTLKVKVTKLSKTNNNIVFSRRALLKEKRAKLFNTFSEVSEEPPKLRSIKQMSKTVESIPGANGFPPAPEAQGIPLDKSIKLIVPEPLKGVIDTSLSISTDFTESLDTYVKDFKPETPKTVEAQRDPLYEPTDLIVPDPVKGVVDSRLPMSKGFSEISISQIQNFKPETLEIGIDSKSREETNNNLQPTAHEREDIFKTHIQNLKPAIFEPDIVSEPPVVVNSNAQKTRQEYGDILSTQIQNLKPEISEAENPNNVTQ